MYCGRVTQTARVCRLHADLFVLELEREEGLEIGDRLAGSRILRDRLLIVAGRDASAARRPGGVR
jgi:hypothetical protein